MEDLNLIIFLCLLGDSGTGDEGNLQNFLKQFQNLITPLLFLAFVLSSTAFSPSQQKEVSLLAPHALYVAIMHHIHRIYSTSNIFPMYWTVSEQPVLIDSIY